MHSELTVIVALLSVLAEARYTPIVKRDVLAFNIPEECKLLTTDFCFIPFDAQQQKIVDNVIHKLNITTVTSMTDKDMFIPSERIGKPKDMCISETEMKKPYYIRDAKDEWRIVVQSPNSTIQNIHMEFCKYPSPVPDNNGIPKNMYKSIVENLNEPVFFYCDNRYYDFHFVVLTPNLNSTESILSKNGVPVGCECHMTTKNRSV